MDSLRPRGGIYSPEYVEQHFACLRDAALQDLTSYVSGWSVYTIDFLNTVAELQAVPERLSAEAVVALRKGPKCIRERRLAILIRDAKDPWSMKIAEILELIAAKAEDRRRMTH